MPRTSWSPSVIARRSGHEEKRRNPAALSDSGGGRAHCGAADPAAGRRFQRLRRRGQRHGRTDRPGLYPLGHPDFGAVPRRRDAARA